MVTSQQALFNKLGITLFRTIESASVLCRQRCNPCVEVVHWLHQMLQLPDSDLRAILWHCGADRARLDYDIAGALAMLPTGTGPISNISHHIGTAIERAWILATQNFNDRKIRGAWLVAALVQTPELRGILLSISTAFCQIPTGCLDKVLPAWVDGSPEAEEACYNLSGFSATTIAKTLGTMSLSSNGSPREQFCTDLT